MQRKIKLLVLSLLLLSCSPEGEEFIDRHLTSQSEIQKAYKSIDANRVRVKNIEALRELRFPNHSRKKEVFVLGYYKPNDGNGGIFHWDPNSREKSNGGTIIKPLDKEIGRWKRVYKDTLNAKWFGAKGDGKTDDTEAIQSSISLLDQGMVFVLPKGIYRTSQILISGKVNINFLFEGEIKALDNINFKQLVHINDSNNSTFDGLTIDGNHGKVFDRKILGDQPNLLIGRSQKNILFKNLELKNSIYCGIVLNGLSENLIFENVVFSNIGEHGFYISGGSNKNLTFKNIKALNLGLNPFNEESNHDCHLFKIRHTRYSTNEDFEMYNIELQQDKEVNIVVCVFNLNNIRGLFIDKVNSPKNAVLILSGVLVENVYLNNVTTPSLVYNVTGEVVVKNLNVSNSLITTGYSHRINIFDKIQNVIFEASRLQFYDIRKFKPDGHKVHFIDCTFMDITGTLRHTLAEVHENVLFEFCKFTSEKNEKTLLPMFVIGNRGGSENVEINFKNTIITGKNWGAAIAVYFPITLRITDSSIDNVIKVNSPSPINSTILLNSTIPKKLLFGSLEKFGKISIVECVDFEGYPVVVEN